MNWNTNITRRKNVYLCKGYNFCSITSLDKHFIIWKIIILIRGDIKFKDRVSFFCVETFETSTNRNAIRTLNLSEIVWQLLIEANICICVQKRKLLFVWYYEGTFYDKEKLLLDRNYEVNQFSLLSIDVEGNESTLRTFRLSDENNYNKIY